MSRKYCTTIEPFEMGTDKEAALKPLEEAAEIFGSYQNGNEYIPHQECVANGYPDCKCEYTKTCFSFEHPELVDSALEDLADKIADCIQACYNLAARYDIDLQAAMERCERRNRERGRYE